MEQGKDKKILYILSDFSYFYPFLEFYISIYFVLVWNFRPLLEVVFFLPDIVVNFRFYTYSSCGRTPCPVVLVTRSYVATHFSSLTHLTPPMSSQSFSQPSDDIESRISITTIVTEIKYPGNGAWSRKGKRMVEMECGQTKKQKGDSLLFSVTTSLQLILSPILTHGRTYTQSHDSPSVSTNSLYWEGNRPDSRVRKWSRSKKKWILHNLQGETVTLIKM